MGLLEAQVAFELGDHGPMRQWEREQIERTTGHAMLVPSLQEEILRLRLALTQARDTLERYRDPLVKVLDGVLAQ